MTRCHPLAAVARRALAAALGALVVAPLAVAAQSRDYLIGAPHGSLALRGGFAFARASSDVFDEAVDLFTLDRGDFSSLFGAADIAITVRPRVDVVLSGGYARSGNDSEDREFVEIIGSDTLPIRQDTRLTRVPLTASLKVYLMPRGHEIGTLAWVPERFAPFIGAGGGATWYRFEQSGDFVFQETEEIFTDRLISDGWAPTWHAFGGIDVAMGPRFALVGEARYAWASTELEVPYDGYDPIDLSGLQTTVGIQVRF